MGIGLSIGLISSSILFFFAFFLFGILYYKKRFNLPYDIRNTFPYEINYQVKFLDNIFVNIFLILSLVSSIGYFIFFDIKNIYGINLVIVISGILLAILIFFLFFADLKYLRFHLLLLVLTAIAAFVLPAGVAILGFIHYQADHSDIFSLIIFIISALLALFIFGAMMNPKLNFRLEMDKEIDKNGNEKLVRPKYFVLAFSEWIFIFSLFLSELLLLLLIIPL